MPSFVITQGNTVTIEATLKDKDGPIDLTQDGGTMAQVFMVAKPVKGNAPAVNQACVVRQVGASTNVGMVQFTWAPPYTDTVGVYHAQFEIRWPLGAERSVPSDEYIDVEILPRLS